MSGTRARNTLEGSGEAVGDRPQPHGFRLDGDLGRDVGAVDDPAQELERGIGQAVLDEDGLKTAAAVDVNQVQRP